MIVKKSGSQPREGSHGKIAEEGSFAGNLNQTARQGLSARIRFTNAITIFSIVRSLLLQTLVSWEPLIRKEEKAPGLPAKRRLSMRRKDRIRGE